MQDIYLALAIMFTFDVMFVIRFVFDVIDVV